MISYDRAVEAIQAWKGHAQCLERERDEALAALRIARLELTALRDELRRQRKA
jgi:hypothetical protein